MEATKQNWLEREFNKETIEIIAKYAPALTPLAPAAAAVAGMTYSLTVGIGGWAWLPALGSGLGMEATGYLSSSLLIRAIRRGDFWSAFLALCFLVGYAGFAIAAMSTMQNASTFQYFVAMSVVTYLCVGLYVYDNKQATAADEKRMREINNRRAALQLEKEEAALQIEREKAHAEIENNRMKWEAEAEHQRTLQANAEARRAKYGQVSSRPKNGQVDKQKEPGFDPAKLAWVKAYYDDPAHAGHSCEKMVAAPGCPFTSRQTALKYRTEAAK